MIMMLIMIIMIIMIGEIKIENSIFRIWLTARIVPMIMMIITLIMIIMMKMIIIEILRIRVASGTTKIVRTREAVSGRDTRRPTPRLHTSHLQVRIIIAS